MIPPLEYFLEAPKGRCIESHVRKNVSRIIIQTDEENPKVITVVTNDDFEVADGYAIRQKPVYEEN